MQQQKNPKRRKNLRIFSEFTTLIIPYALISFEEAVWRVFVEYIKLCEIQNAQSSSDGRNTKTIKEALTKKPTIIKP